MDLKLGRIAGTNRLAGMKKKEWNVPDGMESACGNVVRWLEWVD